MKTYDDLDFLHFTALSSDDTIYDVTIDFSDRSYMIEHCDKKGRLIEERLSNIIRRSRMDQLKKDLETLGLLDWKVTAEFPNTYGSRIAYSFNWDDENDFATEADGDLAKVKVLHHLLEGVTNQTFGSYQFYEG